MILDRPSHCRMTLPAAALYPGDIVIGVSGERNFIHPREVIEPGVMRGVRDDDCRVPLRTEDRCVTLTVLKDRKMRVDRPNLQIPGLEG